MEAVHLECLLLDAQTALLQEAHREWLQSVTAGEQMSSVKLQRTLDLAVGAIRQAHVACAALVTRERLRLDRLAEGGSAGQVDGQT